MAMFGCQTEVRSAIYGRGVTEVDAEAEADWWTHVWMLVSKLIHKRIEFNCTILLPTQNKKKREQARELHVVLRSQSLY